MIEFDYVFATDMPGRETQFMDRFLLLWQGESGQDDYVMQSFRGKDCTGDVVPFGEVCLVRNHLRMEPS